MRVRLGVVLLLCAALGPRTPALAQAPPSALTAAQTLSPADLTPQEAAAYKALATSAEQNSFIVTRSWERLCQAVIDHRLAADQLPDKPLNFSVKYLLPDEPVMINRALSMSLIAEACAGKSAACVAQYGGFAEMTHAQLLTPDQMTAQERGFYAKLSDPKQADEFVRTRSFVRLCQAVIAHQLPAAGLPSKPLGFNLSFLLPGDAATVDQAVRASITAACTGDKAGCF